MREHFVIDPLISKRQQLLLATQLCRLVLKVWDSQYRMTMLTGAGEYGDCCRRRRARVLSEGLGGKLQKHVVIEPVKEESC